MCLKNTLNYVKLGYRLRKYYNHYHARQEHSMTILDSVINSVNECGAVAIKFCQWVTPKLELIYLDSDEIINDDKPTWLLRLESFYDNCDNHELEYTKKEYNRIFKVNIDDVYDVGDIIGSGSIGQVYLVTDKETKQKHVMKILHPDVTDQIIYFRRFIKSLLFLPCIKDKLFKIFPFDIFEFIDQFNEQTNFINEANHLLYFHEEYKDNSYIIIPQLIKCSQSILIMSHEEGESLDDSDLNCYHKDKLVNLYHLFIRNNQMINNYSHGDLHPGNWKIRQDNANQEHKLVIYDFGFCWRIPRQLFLDMGTIFFDTFEESDNDIKTSIDNLCELMYYSVMYDKDDTERYKDRIKQYVISEIDNKGLKEFDIMMAFKTTINFCITENLLLNPILLQCYIIFIQGQKLFERYGLMTSDKQIISNYNVYRERYLNIFTFCKTYDIFRGYSLYIEEKLNSKQMRVDCIFDTIDLDDSIKKLALDCIT